MPRHLNRRTFAVAGVVLLLVLTTAACGRRDLPTNVGAVAAPADATENAATSAPTSVQPETAAPAPTATPGTSPGPTVLATPGPTLAPLATPDLTAIQQLLDDLDAALGADATADTDEGSSK